MFPQFIIPTDLPMRADGVSISKSTLIVDASALQAKSPCPLCKIRSRRVHSKYTRTLTDLPVSSYITKVVLTARRFFCDNPDCRRKVFAERFDTEIRSYCRRFLRSDDLLAKIGLELGGNCGSRISQAMEIPVSSSTILRIIKTLEIIPRVVTSGIIGVDDWALKKGHTYGTAIVDLESREVIDLLEDRDSETLAEWLKRHPEVTTVSRDRYGPYALGIKNGAPQAQQVADRFHLLMNLGNATKRIIQSKGKELKDAFRQYSSPVEESSEAPSHEFGSTEEEDGSETDDNPTRQFKFERVNELHILKYSTRAISKILKMSRATVMNYIKVEKLTKRAPRSLLNFDSFITFLLREENKEKTYKELYQQVEKMGFNGKYTQFCHRMNKLYKIEAGTRHGVLKQRALILTWTPTQVSKLLYLESEEITKKEDRGFLECLYQACPAIKEVEVMIKKFKNMFTEKQDGLLEAWITEASKPESQLKNFAKGLRKDYEAVNNAVITDYSNGQLEGQVNRIKNIKRRMYGRAGFQLLRKMVLVKMEAFHQN